MIAQPELKVEFETLLTCSCSLNGMTGEEVSDKARYGTLKSIRQ